MSASIRPFLEADLAEVVALSLLAWAPVFASFEQVLGSEIFSRLYPDWKAGQARAVTDLCSADNTETWVAESGRTVTGFTVYELNDKDHVGEVHMLAVHPDHQERGIGASLNQFALTQLKAAGMRLAVVQYRWRSRTCSRQAIVRESWLYRASPGSVLQSPVTGRFSETHRFAFGPAPRHEGSHVLSSALPAPQRVNALTLVMFRHRWGGTALASLGPPPRLPASVDPP